MAVDGCLEDRIQVAADLRGAAQEREVEGTIDAVVVVTDSLEGAAAAVAAGYEVEAGQRKEEDLPWKSEEPYAGCICGQVREMGPEEVQERQSIAAARSGIVAEACSSGLQVAAEGSLSEAGACCFGTEALRKPRPCYDCRMLEVFQRWTMLSLIVIA
jgi:hypothetical protein